MWSNTIEFSLLVFYGFTQHFSLRHFKCLSSSSSSVWHQYILRCQNYNRTNTKPKSNCSKKGPGNKIKVTFATWNDLNLSWEFHDFWVELITVFIRVIVRASSFTSVLITGPQHLQRTQVCLPLLWFLLALFYLSRAVHKTSAASLDWQTLTFLISCQLRVLGALLFSTSRAQSTPLQRRCEWKETKGWDQV